MTKNLNNIKEYKYSIFFFIVLLFITFLNFSIEIKSIFFIVFLLMASFYIPEIRTINLKSMPVALVVLFLFLMFTQTQYL